MQPFNDVTLSNWNWEDFKLEHIVKDIKLRTDTIKIELDAMATVDTNLQSSQKLQDDIITNLDKKLTIIDDKIEDMTVIIGALLLKETSVITEEELKTVYKMFTSPDKENKVVAVEVITNKLKELL